VPHMSDERVVFAWKEPPDSFNFRKSKSGKCWFRKVDTLSFAIELSRQLVALDIHGVIKKAAGPQRAPPDDRRRKAR
jgi:hypothetical protein